MICVWMSEATGFKDEIGVLEDEADIFHSITFLNFILYFFL